MTDEPRPVVEHLEELRYRLFWILGTWTVFALIAGYWVRDVYEILMNPAVSSVREAGHKLIAIAPPELFLTYVKTAILAGFLVSMPMTLYQVWSFIAPGLYANERKFALPFVVATSLLFAAGCSFGYFIAFPQVFEWFLSLEADYVTTSWTTQTVFAFMARLYLAFGLAFELPIILVFLAIARIVTPAQLSSWRKYAVLVMFVVAALLTPADVASQIMLAVPLILLYEISIWVSYLLVGRKPAEAEAPATE